MKNLGFGMMRLPVLSGPTDFDYEQLNRMVDAFLAAGYTYFDTSYVYHNGKSEEATRKALVERHPRDSFRKRRSKRPFNISWTTSVWIISIITYSTIFKTSITTVMTARVGL